MSGTRSPFPRAPATDALIVAHGQPSDPWPAEAEIAALAQKVAALSPGLRVGAATLAAPGALQAALARCSDPPRIYPLFMSDGWFTETALPRRLNGAAGEILAPLGCDPALPQLARGVLMDVCARRGWRPEDLTLVLAAHGSGRSRNAARAARSFAARLSGLMPLRAIRTGFVEERPSIAEAARDAGPIATCLPFFAAALGHVRDDIPGELAAAGFEGATLDPIGTASGIPRLIASAIGRTASDREAAAPAGVSPG